MSEATVVRKERRIDSGEPLLVRDPPDGVAAYAVSTATCDNPQCTCTTLWLSIRPAVRTDDGAFEVRGPALRAEVSSDGSDLKLDEDRTGSFPGEVIAWLCEQLSHEEHRGWLRERWRRSRGQVGDPAYPSGLPPKDVDWLASFHDVFPYDFDLVVAHDGRLYLADDQYCLKPGCTCEEVVVCFVDVQTGRALGAARASARHPHKARIEGTPGIRQLWNALLDEYGRPPLRERFQRMRAVARQSQVRPPGPDVRPNVGRNDPCPCGSGRKFKRCCGASPPPLRRNSATD